MKKRKEKISRGASAPAETGPRNLFRYVSLNQHTRVQILWGRDNEMLVFPGGKTARLSSNQQRKA